MVRVRTMNPLTPSPLKMYEPSVRVPARRVAWGIVLAPLLAVTADVHAEVSGNEPSACARAAESGQELRRRGKLVDALGRFQRCARATCPSVITADCVRFAAQTEAALPSIVFRVSDDQGRDIVDVRVLVDGKEATRKADGRAIPLDPGPHQVTFLLDGHPPIERRIVAVEGEKARTLHHSLEKPVSSGPPPASWVLGSVGAGAIAGFAFFGTVAKLQHDELKDTCGVTATCTERQVSSYENKAIAADVMLGVGLLSFGVAGALWALSDETSEVSGAAPALSFGWQPAGGTVVWRAPF